jgi:nucleoside phosphorylase
MTKLFADILLVTATKIESKSVFDAFKLSTKQKAEPYFIEDRVFFDLGEINGARVFMIQSEMGAVGINASIITVQKGIEALSPTAVIMVGIAFGIDEEHQKIGEILVA